ncbi:hypothetical protein PENFLA_c004G03554 [Penicillium flavigenum]|uniref:AMP-dependent synthetase/ligase domain-containing protein n=1 Tax=Penicillium flavigenum TaxID=254877 RepID=A0A1V6TT98_9EURO|nr:hypothetical protein PENFLA_c004G03554 [Penicillium flavigenum]
MDFTAPTYTLEEILAVSTIHPFYNSTIRFPPTKSQIDAAIGDKQGKQCPNLTNLPLTKKDNLYKIIQRLIEDDAPDNLFRHASYVSTTGGGSGRLPMLYLTDARENRIQRMSMGNLVRQCGVIVPGDCVLTMHASGNLYRSLDLTSEVMENAGGTVFCAGHHMPHAEVGRLVSAFRINVICGDSSQVLQFALYVSSLPETQREAIQINKVIYTSEPLVRSQQAYIKSVFGDVPICSLFASAESGPWAVMNHAVTNYQDDDSADFIFDTRNIIIEVLPHRATEQARNESHEDIKPLAEGETGVIAVTSLQRLRNPLIRYLSGDIGSLHPVPANDIIDPEESRHFKILRLHGRDQRFSFNWQGEYFDFKAILNLMQSDELSVLQWQIFRTQMSTSTHSLEVRVLRGQSGVQTLSDGELVQKLKRFFHVVHDTEAYFQVIFVSGLQGFQRSRTGNKVMRFVDI